MNHPLAQLLEHYRTEYWGGPEAPDPTEVEGTCTAYAWELVEFLCANGVEARVRYLEHPYEIGYTDRTRIPDPDEGHAVAEVGRYLIDYCAAQYGYSEFPMILCDGKRTEAI